MEHLCSNNCVGWLGVVGIIATICTAIFTYLAAAIARHNAIIDTQIKLMPKRIRIASVTTGFIEALKIGFEKLQNNERSERTVHKLGEEWLSAIVAGLEYECIAHRIGYVPKVDDPPSRVYSDGINGFSELVKQARFVFSKDVYSELNNLLDLFRKYGRAVPEISFQDSPLSDDEIAEIDSFISRNNDLASNIDSEIKLDKIPILCSRTMRKIVFLGRER